MGLRQTCCLLALALGCARAEIAPRQYLESAWGVKDGLPDNTVNAIVQTADGYVWLGTEKGLARFDGVRFQIFDSWNTKELHSDRISSLCQDAEGHLWIGTKGGGVTRHQLGVFSHAGLSSQFVSALYADRRGRVWVGTAGGGLFVFSDGSVESYSSSSGLPDLFVGAICEGRNGTIWLGTRSAGLVGLAQGVFRTHPGVAHLEPSPINALCEDDDGQLWLGTAAGLVRVSEGQARLFTVRDGLPSDQILSIRSDHQRGLWVGTKVGAVAFPLRGEDSPARPQPWLRGQSVASCAIDRDGDIWLGTAGEGLKQLAVMRFGSLGAQDGLSHEVVSCVLESRLGELWVGTYGGLNRLAGGVLSRWSTPQGLAHPIVTALLEDAEGTVWVGTQEGMNRVAGGRVQTCPRDEGWPQTSVWAFHQDASGTLWMGTADGLYGKKAGVMARYSVEDGLPSNDIRTLAEGRGGVLWIGTSHGLASRGHDAFRPFTLPSGSLTRIILCLREDSEGVLWCGTLGGGLLRLHDGAATAFTVREGFPDSTIYQILEDGLGSLWLTCNRGLFRVSKAELNRRSLGERGSITPTVFTRADGLPSEECKGFSQPAGWRCRDGKLWFPTSKGLAVADPASMGTTSLPPAIILEQVVADNESLPLSERISIKPGRERIEFRFVALCYRMPDRVRFRYILEGFDKEWTDAGSRRAAYYTRVPPGQYRFRVTACNHEGIWNVAGTTATLIVRPEYWQTAWFRGGALTVAGLTMFGVHRSRLARVRALERLRLRIAQDLHDDLGASLTEIALMSDPEHPEFTEAGRIRPHLERISGRARSVVQALNEIVWAVNPRNDTLPKLLDYLCAFSEELCESAGVRCWHEVPTGLAARPLKVEYRHNLFLAVKEALNNVLKHAGVAELWLRVVVEDTRLTIVIEDKGRGFACGGARPGRNGLENMRTRLEEIGGRAEVASEPGRGTTVSFTAPLRRG